MLNRQLELICNLPVIQVTRGLATLRHVLEKIPVTSVNRTSIVISYRAILPSSDVTEISKDAALSQHVKTPGTMPIRLNSNCQTREVLLAQLQPGMHFMQQLRALSS